MNGRTRKWLESYSWSFVTAQNMLLCQAKNALHKSTSDGHDETKALWEAKFQEEMPLDEAVELCRRCHRMAPFCFYNGNTFAGIIRDVVMSLGLEADKASVVRSLAGHIVAGVADELEEKEFRQFCESLDH